MRHYVHTDGRSAYRCRVDQSHLCRRNAQCISQQRDPEHQLPGLGWMRLLNDGELAIVLGLRLEADNFDDIAEGPSQNPKKNH